MTNGFKYGGYKGQLLRVNLSKKAVTKERLREDWARDFVGGAGYSARLLYDEIPGKSDPLGDPAGNAQAGERAGTRAVRDAVELRRLQAVPSQELIDHRQQELGMPLPGMHFAGFQHAGTP